MLQMYLTFVHDKYIRYGLTIIQVSLTCNGIVCVTGGVSAIGAPNLPIARGAIVLDKNSIVCYSRIVLYTINNSP